MNMFLRSIVLSSIVFAQTPAFAMLKDGDSVRTSGDELPKSGVTRTPISKGKRNDEGTSSAVESSSLVKELFQHGFFVHAVRQDLFDPEYDLTLKAGSMIPMTMNIGGMASAFLGALKGNQKAEVAGILNPLLGMGSRTTYKMNPDQFRPCLYFTLNCLVEGHAGLNLEEYSSVAFIPAHELLPDVVNLFPTDTAVWRSQVNLRETPGTVVMIPENRKVPESFDLGLVKLERFTGDMTEAVNRFLDERTRMRVTLHSAPEGQENLLDRATLNGVELGEPAPFAEYLRENPVVSFGHEASPKRTGMGPCLKILNILVKDFNETWKIGVLKDGKSKGPEYIHKYRAEPFVILGEEVKAELERMIERLGNPIIREHYEAVEKSKISRALLNLRNLVTHKQRTVTGRKRWNDRPYSFTISLRLADFPYEVAQRVLGNEWLAPVREETEVHYWFYRHITGFYGVIPCDDMDVLANLRNSAVKLRAKLDRGEFSWPYAQYLNSIMALAMTAKGIEGFSEHYLQGLRALDVTLPSRGSIFVTSKSGKGDVQVIGTLKAQGIKVSSDLLKNGLRKIPDLVSNNPFNESF